MIEMHLRPLLDSDYGLRRDTEAYYRAAGYLGNGGNAARVMAAPYSQSNAGYTYSSSGVMGSGFWDV